MAAADLLLQVRLGIASREMYFNFLFMIVLVVSHLLTEELTVICNHREKRAFQLHDCMTSAGDFLY